MGFKILTERESKVRNAEMLHGNLRLKNVLHYGENHKQTNYEHYANGVDALFAMQGAFLTAWQNHKITKITSSVEVFDFNVWEKNDVGWVAGKFECGDCFIDLLDQIQDFYKEKEEPNITKDDITNFLLTTTFKPLVEGVVMIPHEK
jgi:hypothetical protein